MALSSTISRLIAIPLLLVASDSTGGVSGSGPTTERSLERSLLKRDLSRLAEIGARASAADLAAFLAPDRERSVTLAAIAAAPQCGDAWALLLPLGTAANGPDQPIASAAARSALEIAQSLDLATIAEQDIPDDLLAEALDAWRAIATASHRWADVRVHGLAVVVALSALHHPEPPDPPPSTVEWLTQLAGDPDPEVRRAAFELMPVSMPMPDPALAVAARTVAEDSDPVVALAAAQAICSELVADDESEKLSSRVLAALGPEGLARLHQLTATTTETDDALSPAALLDGARCLAAAGDPKSLQALRGLQSRGPRYLRQRIRELLGQRRATPTR